MSHRVKKYLPLIKALASTPVSMRKRIIHNIDMDFAKCICEICANIIKGNVKMKPCQKRKLRRFRKVIECLARKGMPLTKKTRNIVQSGGSFLPLLFSIVAPLLTRLISS